MTGCPCNARGQTATVLPRQYPLQARSARLRLSVAGGPGRFAMNRWGAGTAEELGGVSSTAWALSGIPPPGALPTHSRRWPARCKTKHGRAAAAQQLSSLRPPGPWPVGGQGRSSCAGFSFRYSWSSATLDTGRWPILAGLALGWPGCPLLSTQYGFLTAFWHCVPSSW